ncbi:MAG: hypothetical protein QOC54_1865, partial [Baekduia sp.]|nr:hypothetical protein [Baekduia sp.]
PTEFPLAAIAARSVAGRALDQASRTMISVHGGTGATWEHDAPLYFRRAQLSRRLLGGTAGAEGVTVEQVVRYDVTRALAHVTLDGARGTGLSTTGAITADAWYVAQALLAAEAVGTVQTTLDLSVQYAKERFTFGRAIGSYQSIKHELTEVLRRMENARSLLYYAGWARTDAPDEFPLAASAARSAAGGALDFAARSVINVHGGIGATWEHDAPLYFRRAQLTRRLVGGHGDATDRVAERLLAT